MAIKDNLKLVGSFSTTKGIKGDVKFRLTEDVEIENELKNEFIFIEEKENMIIPLEVERTMISNKDIVFSLKELNSIEDAAKYLRKNVYVKDDSFDKYFYELVNFKGFKVVENEKEIGSVLEVMHNGAYELFKINLNGKDVWIPNVKRYIPEIDYENNILNIVDSEVFK